jgi:hypothetical protein
MCPSLDPADQRWQFAIMVKTQIQIPDHLYREAKRIAAEYEMSFAEVVRRSLERTVTAYPKRASTGWLPPVPRDLGQRCKLDDDELRLLANEPAYIPRRLRSKSS